MSEPMNYTLAVFRSEYGCERALPMSWGTNDIQISESVEVEFKPLPDETVISNQIVAIEKKIVETREKATKEIEELSQKRQELLALEHTPCK